MMRYMDKDQSRYMQIDKLILIIACNDQSGYLI